jgi:hypothetical protein
MRREDKGEVQQAKIRAWEREGNGRGYGDI